MGQRCTNIVRIFRLLLFRLFEIVESFIHLRSPKFFLLSETRSTHALDENDAYVLRNNQKYIRPLFPYKEH